MSDEYLYNLMIELAELRGATYKDIAAYLTETGDATNIDGIAWDHPALNIPELDGMVREMSGVEE